MESVEALFEEELRRDPFRVKVWARYLSTRGRVPRRADLDSDDINIKKRALMPAEERDALIQWRIGIYERALLSLPGSYKLWHAYLKECVDMTESWGFEEVVDLGVDLPVSLLMRMEKVMDCGQKVDLGLVDVSGRSVNFEQTCDRFERCLVHQGKRPRIWLLYTSFLRRRGLISRTRRAFDKCLRSIPITQHELVWEQILDFAEKCGVVRTALCLFNRYITLEPQNVERYITFLKKHTLFDQAALLLANALNDPAFTPQLQSRHQLWMDLCTMLCEESASIKSVSVEKVLRSGLRRFTDEIGLLWCSLADHFVAQGLIENVCDVYEEAMESISTLHDFALVFDAYAAFQENLVSAKLELGTINPENTKEVDIYMARLENLLSRRKELVSSVRLRQNPHNVNEWLNRAHVFSEHPPKVIETFSDGVRTVEPEEAVGRLGILWVKFAKYYQSFCELDNARYVFDKATTVNFKGIDDLATVWCEWVEMELRENEWDAALKVARQMIFRPPSTDPASAQGRLYRSVKLWSLAADIEESLGTMETVRTVYDKMFALKVITPQLVMNFAQYLQEMKFYEDSFKVYERAIALFKWPHKHDILVIYLTKIVERLGPTKLERARELFEQVIADVPDQYARRFYLLYARLEEEHGLAKHALSIYQKATQVVPLERKYDMYRLYIAKTQELFGIVKTRPIYEQAITILPDDQTKMMCIKFAEMEMGLGEIDRARAVFEHASQFADPSRDPNFWKTWRSFEVAHGHEDTFRDMLRVKRSVQAQYSQVHFNAAELCAEDAPKVVHNPMEAAEAELKAQSGTN